VEGIGGRDEVGVVVGMARTAIRPILLVFVEIIYVIYASLGISKKGDGDGGDRLAD
jgi:hypothetical protein